MGYSFFSDVVCFGTTCKTTQYGRPLGIYGGINNHRRTIIFGVTLLFDETIPSFNWIFSTFVQIMGKEPKTIILTDQVNEMATTIEMSYPTLVIVCVFGICIKMLVIT